MDNRWGDFRLAAFKGMIGAEARRFRYADETAPNPGWQASGIDDANWKKVTCGFGPMFWILGPFPEHADTSQLEAQLVA